MTDQLQFQQLLRNHFSSMRMKNPRISVRAYAKRLGLSASATNEILKGQRRVSLKLATRVIGKMALGPTERYETLRHFKRPAEPVPDPLPYTDHESLRLSADQFELISDWVHFAILSLVKIPDFKCSEIDASIRLGVPERRIKEACLRLERVGLLKRTRGQRWSRIPQRIQTSDDVENSAIQKSHQENLELALNSLLQDPVENRDFSYLTLPADPDRLGRAKEMLREAQDKIAAFLEGGKPKTVYRLTTLLFPLETMERRKK